MPPVVPAPAAPEKPTGILSASVFRTSTRAVVVHVGVDAGQDAVGHVGLEMVLRQEGAEAQRVGPVVVGHEFELHGLAGDDQQRLHVIDADAVDPVAGLHRLRRHIGAARAERRHRQSAKQRRANPRQFRHDAPRHIGPARHAPAPSAPCARQPSARLPAARPLGHVKQKPDPLPAGRCSPLTVNSWWYRLRQMSTGDCIR